MSHLRGFPWSDTFMASLSGDGAVAASFFQAGGCTGLATPRKSSWAWKPGARQVYYANTLTRYVPFCKHTWDWVNVTCQPNPIPKSWTSQSRWSPGGQDHRGGELWLPISAKWESKNWSSFKQFQEPVSKAAPRAVAQRGLQDQQAAASGRWEGRTGEFANCLCVSYTSSRLGFFVCQ